MKVQIDTNPDIFTFNYSINDIDNDFINFCINNFCSYERNRSYKFETEKTDNNITTLYRYKSTSINNDINININDTFILSCQNSTNINFIKERKFKISEFPDIVYFLQDQCPHLYNYINDNIDEEYIVSISQNYEKYYSQTKVADMTNLFNEIQYCLITDSIFQFIALISIMAKFYNETSIFNMKISSQYDNNLNIYRFDPERISKGLTKLISCLTTKENFDNIINEDIPLICETNNITNLEKLQCFYNTILTSSNIRLKYKNNRDIRLIAYLNHINK